MILKKYRTSDLILDSLKAFCLHLGFYLVGFVAYAASAGHIMMDEYADKAAKHSALLLYSGVMIAIGLIILCVYEKKSIGRKARLIEASRADDFDEKAYFKEMLKRRALPLFIGGLIALLPYAVFYTKFGWDYLYPSLVDRFYAASMLFVGLFGGILGALIHNLVIVGVYAVSLYKTQRSELEDRMWIKDAPKQQDVKLNKPKDNYKNY